ncbi:PAS domain S-box protein [Desulfocurvibacter africanus]|uniref:PAS domain S-box protein n=1 Tax=Desulfocurvibacter africanus TaxID=873 RepID=UPI00068817C5|nr:PAS domain S-box protein [Desulfocurvibacter africanus]
MPGIEKSRQELLAEAALLKERLRELGRERDLLASLVESASDEIWFCAPDESFARPLNKAARDFLSLARAGLPPLQRAEADSPLPIFKTQAALLSPAESPLRRALAGETVHGDEAVLLPESGEVRHREYRASPIRDEQGAVSGVVAIARDVTKTRKAEAALRESDESFQVALAHTPVMVFAADMDQRFSWVFNPPFGLTAEEIIGKTLQELIKPEDASEVQALVSELIESGRAIRQEVVIRFRGRETCWDVTIEPRRDARGIISGLIGVAYDLTERRWAEKAREQSDEKFRRIFHLSPAILAISTLQDGVYLDVNEAFSKLLGYSREEATGKSAFEFQLWAEPAQRNLLAAQLKERGSLRSRLVRYRCKSGEIKTLVISAELMEVEGQQCVLAAASDFTMQQRRHDAIRKREVEWRAIVENTSDIIARIGRDSRFTYVNQAVTKATGLLPREIVGKAFHERGFSVENLAKARRALKTVFDSGKPGLLELAASGQGRPVTLQVCLVPEFSRTGEVETVLAISRDISELKQTEQELRSSREHYRLLYESVPLGYQSLDARGCYLEVNHAWLEAMGYSREDVIGQRFGRFVAESAAYLAESFAAFKQCGEISGAEFEMVRKDGSRFIAAFYGKISTDEQGRFRQTHCIMHDVTARKRAEEEIRRAQTEAEAASRAKSMFLAHMSHELRTPLNGVLGMIELAHMACADKKQCKYLELAKQSGHTLLDIINDILDLAKIEAGKAELKNEPFSLREVMESTIEPLAMLGRRKGLDVSWRMDPRIPDRLAGDQGRLRQVLANLVGNALKFTERGSVSVDLGLSTGGFETRPYCPAGLGLIFSIADTGIGIPQDKLPHLFESFTQALTSAHVKFGGTGLGLCISKRLVEMMQGTIWAESVAGQGSTFSFTAVFCVPQQPTLPDAAPACGPGVQGRRLRVLVAEDNQINQVLIRELLGMQGHTASIVGTGLEALQALRQAEYDLVLMDIRMPDMNGLQAVQRIRAGEAGKTDIPVIALTAYALDGDRKRFLAAGMDGYLAKPIRIEEFNTVLRDVAGRASG